MTLSKYRILLIDDHEVVRAGICLAISAEPDLEVIAQKSDAQSALVILAESKPDLAIIDINMPGMNAFEMVEASKKILPNLKFIFLTGYASDSNLEKALQCGASGFVSKTESLTTIASAIRCVKEGQVPYFSNDIRDRVISVPRDRILGSSQTGPKLVARKNLLSPREREILCCVARGQSAKQIASELTISSKTVERHKSNIMTKLHMHTQVDLTRYAIKEGLVVL